MVFLWFHRGTIIPPGLQTHRQLLPPRTLRAAPRAVEDAGGAAEAPPLTAATGRTWKPELPPKDGHESCRAIGFVSPIHTY